MEFDRVDVILKRHIRVGKEEFDNMSKCVQADVVEASKKRRLDIVIKRVHEAVRVNFGVRLVILKYECDVDCLKYGYVREFYCEVYDTNYSQVRVLKIGILEKLVKEVKISMVSGFERERDNLKFLRDCGFPCPEGFLSMCEDYIFFLTDRILGVTVDKIWTFISDSDRKNIREKMESYIASIDSISKIGVCTIASSNFIYNNCDIVGLVDWSVIIFTRYSHLPLKAEDPTLIRTDKGHNER